MQLRKIDKVIVTNRSALRAKYGLAGLKLVQKAVKQLIAQDMKRGLISALVMLDDQRGLAKLGGKAVASAKDPKQNKDTIDIIYTALAPDYLLILGAIDIVPHQDLKNPAYSAGDDDDRIAFGDIPYACEAPYSRKPQQFFGPTRVVGRLPDLIGAKTPRYLLALLKTASTYKQTEQAAYRLYLGVSTADCKGSTKRSLMNVFASPADIELVPPRGPTWPKALMKRRTHFFNCLGVKNCSQFYGQPVSGAGDFPTALDATNLGGNLSEGTVVVAESCYGAQLFDPIVNAGQMSIANKYLVSKAYAFFGSTTTAYGSVSANHQADLICQYFLQSLLKGASLGRAALEARQQFVRTATMRNPLNVKTIAQFILLGDPSIVPIAQAHAVANRREGVILARSGAIRAERRRDLFVSGIALSAGQWNIVKTSGGLPRSLMPRLRKTAKSSGITMGTVLSFEATTPALFKTMPEPLLAAESLPRRVHVVFRKRDAAKLAINRMGASVSGASPPVIDIAVLVVEEQNGVITSVEKIVSR